MARGGIQKLLEFVLEPLADLNIAALFDVYHAPIDFILYLVLMTFIARISLSRMFDDPHARRVSMVVGLMLAISLATMEQTLGFSLRSFGPLNPGGDGL